MGDVESGLAGGMKRPTLRRQVTAAERRRTTVNLLRDLPAEHSGLLRRKRVLGWTKPVLCEVKSGYLVVYTSTAVKTFNSKKALAKNGRASALRKETRLIDLNKVAVEALPVSAKKSATSKTRWQLQLRIKTKSQKSKHISATGCPATVSAAGTKGGDDGASCCKPGDAARSVSGVMRCAQRVADAAAAEAPRELGRVILRLAASSEGERDAWVARLRQVRRRNMEDYEVVTTLGAGAYGRVSLVRQRTDASDCAAMAAATPRDVKQLLERVDAATAAAAALVGHVGKATDSASSATAPSTTSSASTASSSSTTLAATTTPAGTKTLLAPTPASDLSATAPPAAAAAPSLRRGRYFALKEVPLSLVQNSAHRVLEERRVLQQVRGAPFLCQLHSAFVQGGRLHYVQNLGDGGDLFENAMLQPKNRFAEPVARLIAAELVVAVRYLHNLNIMHRDIKMENILLDRDGHIVLADFGLAKTLGSAAQRSYSFVGTERYCAPEMWAEHGHSLAVDWWQVGCVLYELIVGRPPFYSKDPKRQRRLILAGKLTLPSYVSKEASSLIAGLLTPEAWRRLGGKEVAEHPFFSGIDFDAVAAKKVAPLFKPDLAALAKRRNASKTDMVHSALRKRFTSSAPAAAAAAQAAASVGDASLEEAFLGFDYCAAPPLLTSISADAASGGGGATEDALLTSDDDDDDDGTGAVAAATAAAVTSAAVAAAAGLELAVEVVDADDDDDDSQSGRLTSRELDERDSQLSDSDDGASVTDGGISSSGGGARTTSREAGESRAASSSSSGTSISSSGTSAVSTTPRPSPPPLPSLSAAALDDAVAAMASLHVAAEAQASSVGAGAGAGAGAGGQLHLS